MAGTLLTEFPPLSFPLDFCYPSNTIINHLAINISAFTALNRLFPEATLTGQVLLILKKNSNTSVKNVFYFDMSRVHMCKGPWIVCTLPCPWCVSAAEGSHAGHASHSQEPDQLSTVIRLIEWEKHGSCEAVVCPSSRYSDKTDEQGSFHPGGQCCALRITARTQVQVQPRCTD